LEVQSWSRPANGIEHRNVSYEYGRASLATYPEWPELAGCCLCSAANNLLDPVKSHRQLRDPLRPVEILVSISNIDEGVLALSAKSGQSVT